MNPRMASKRGFMMVGVIYICVVFVVLIVAFIAWSVNEYSWTMRSYLGLKALNLADAGAEYAFWEIAHNGAAFTSWSGVNPKTFSVAGFRDNSDEPAGDIYVNVDNTSPGHYTVSSAGFVPSAANLIARRRVKVYVYPHPLFNNALFGKTSLAVTGNGVADSYDSRLGPYSLATARSNADVGTNGAFTIDPNALVKGDVFVGPNGTLSGDVATKVTGDVYHWGAEVELPGKTMPSYDPAILQPPLNVSGGNESHPKVVTIPSGTCVYQSIACSGNYSTLIIPANTRLYVLGDFTVTGQARVTTYEGVEIYVGGTGNFAGQGLVNATGVPSNLQVFGTGTSPMLSFTGLNDFYGAIYAPDSTVYMGGNAQFFGAAVGDDVTLAGNTTFHYDEALSDVGPFSGYDIAYWQEE